MYDQTILHLDRLPLADLGKFSMILSQMLTSDQRADLNCTHPDLMAAMGAFESQIPQVKGFQVTQETWGLAAAAMQGNKKIQAIKEVRAGTGMGLKEAKEYVDIHMQYLQP